MKQMWGEILTYKQVKALMKEARKLNKEASRKLNKEDLIKKASRKLD